MANDCSKENWCLALLAMNKTFISDLLCRYGGIEIMKKLSELPEFIGSQIIFNLNESVSKMISQ